MAHFCGEVERGVVVDVAGHLVGFAREQQLDHVVAVVLAGLVDRRLVALGAALRLRLVVQEHAGHLQLTQFARDVQGGHFVHADGVHVRHQVPVELLVQQFLHRTQIVLLHLFGEFLVALSFDCPPLAPVTVRSVTDATCFRNPRRVF